MRRQHHRPPPTVVVADGGLEGMARRGIHPSRRLVEEQHLGTADGDGGDRHALALTPGEASRMPLGERDDAQALEPTVDSRSALVVVASPEESERLGNLATHRRSEQERARILGHVRDACRADDRVRVPAT